MARAAPPPDFRYVALDPGPSSREVSLYATGAGIATFGAGLALGGGAEAGTLAAAALAGAVTALFVARRRGPVLPGAGRGSAHMAIVPWGVLVHSEPTPRVLRWAAVKSVGVEFVHEMDHATPSTRWSVVRIVTEREVLGGRTPGDVSLERLQAHLPAYAAEAARPVALDLDGTEAIDRDFGEHSLDRLFDSAARLLSSGLLLERLSLPPASYREARPRATSDEASRVLRAIIEGEVDTPADPRPLACVVAAELGAKQLLHAIVELTTSPHPLVAALARAAAIRLGAPVKRVGSLQEIAAFLPEGTIHLVESWCADPGRTNPR